MDITLIKVDGGFRYATDADYEKGMKLKRNVPLKCKITEIRNYKFHRKYFAFINLCWEYLTEQQQHWFKDSKECFRGTVEVSAGYCTRVYSLTRNDWQDVPKSIAFDKMTEEEFENLYESVKTVVFTKILKNISYEEFTETLSTF